MKHIPRFYIEEALSQNKKIILSDSQQHHAFTVLRLSNNDVLHVFNDTYGEWSAHVAERKAIICDNLLINPRKENGGSIAICLIHPSKFSFVLEKCTELGVTEIIPIISQYSQYKTINYEKCMQTILSACEQCCRLSFPKLSNVISLPDFLKSFPNDRSLLIGDTIDNPNTVKDVVDSNSVFLIGPEGGFSETERTLFNQYDFIKTFHYGNNVLRSETAAIAFLSCWNELA